ncbi:MAG: cyclic nucleotide-binding domain-containing protein [Actinomycetota bacterium]
MARRKRNDYLDRLATVPLFSNLEDDELEVVARLGTEVPVPEGRIIAKEGDVAHEAFLLMEGTARCTRDGEELATFEPGDFFGEMALISHRSRNATVETTSDANLRAFDEGEFRRMLHESPAVAVKILLATAERLLDSEDSPTH